MVKYRWAIIIILKIPITIIMETHGSSYDELGILINGGIINTRERITSTFDGISHQSFRAAKAFMNTEESDSDDEEDYIIKRNKFGAPIYGTPPLYPIETNCKS